jgi:hypothetical protein
MSNFWEDLLYTCLGIIIGTLACVGFFIIIIELF